MNSIQFGLIIYCLLLSCFGVHSMDERKNRSGQRNYNKVKQVKRDTIDKPKLTKENIISGKRATENEDWTATYDSLLRIMDSLSIENTMLKDQLENHERSQSKKASQLNKMWAKYIESFKVEGNQAKKVVFNEKSFDTYIVNVAKSDVRFFWRDENEKPIRSLEGLMDILETDGPEKLVFGTNAGMYTPSGSPQGLFIEDGQVLRKIDRDKDKFGNFYMQPNGVFLIDTNDIPSIIPTSAYNDELNKAVKIATQSGPMVVVDGAINKIFKKDSKHLNIRSGVGIIDSTHVVFVISTRQVNFYDFAHVFIENFNCSNALYLDGAISEMYLPELQRFQNGGNFGPMIGIISKQ